MDFYSNGGTHDKQYCVHESIVLFAIITNEQLKLVTPFQLCLKTTKFDLMGRYRCLHE